MAWRDHLLPAALDGVPFLYGEVGTRGGRRGELHEFPGRDDPFAEDLGRKARSYQVRAFILGENYFEPRDALVDVLEAGGNHVLTHPYRGDLVVKLIGEYTIKESDQEGGIAEFDFTLVEAGQSIPTLFISTGDKVRDLKLEALAAAAAKTKFSLLGAIGDVLKSVSDGVGKAASALRKVNGKISGALGLVDNITAEIDGLEAEITTLLNTPQALMTKVGALVDSIFGLVSDFIPETPASGVRIEPVDLVATTLEATTQLFGFTSEADTIPTPTEQRQLEHDAHAAIEIHVKAATVASGAATLAGLELRSADQAQTILVTLAEMLDEVLAADIDGEVAESFATLKAATVQHFTEQARSLPQVTTLTPPTTTPALVLAYELYGDPDLDDDLILRNKIRHPTFVQGGRALEVLSDV